MTAHLLNSKKKILVTSALPYANGDIHLGHLVEYVQTDIWVRFLRQLGHEVHYVCADDAHGTAISIAAKNSNQQPEEMIAKIKHKHEQDLRAYGVDFDNYYTTHSSENEKLTTDIFNTLQQNNYIYTEEVEQLYDAEEKLFLADRFVKGKCPKCGAEDQYGDNCDVCGTTYPATSLIDPYSVYSKSKPTVKKSKHYFFRLEDFREFLQGFLKTAVAPTLQKKMLEWFDEELKSWDISRDAPYFGFKIPNEDSKYFYVWLDAPVGYMASFLNLCNAKNIDFAEYWKKDSEAELYHFIGKDIVYFHALFWAAVLHGSNHRVPNGIFVHGFLTINGSKMSKSKNTFITAESFGKKVEPELLRYYLAHKINGSIEDIDLNLTDFVAKINSDLIGKIINIASRCAGLLKKANDSVIVASDNELLTASANYKQEIQQAYLDRNYSKVIKLVVELATNANRYLSDAAPWVLIKEESQLAKVTEICSVGLNLFYHIMLYIAPIMPNLASRSFSFLNTSHTSLAQIKNLDADLKVNKFKPLLNRVQLEQINDF